MVVIRLRDTWREERNPLLAVMVVAAALVLPLVHQQLVGGTVFGFNDMTVHVNRALAMDLWPFHPLVPHWLTHLAIRLGYLATGGWSVNFVVYVLLGTLRAATAALIYLGCRRAIPATGPRLSRRLAIATTLAALLVESPRVLLRGTEMTQGNAFLPIQYVIGPTGIGSLPLALLALSALVGFTRRLARRTLTAAYGAFTAALLVFGALAKPSFLQGTIPVLPLWIAWYGHRMGANLRSMVAPIAGWIVLPSVLVLGWQVYWLRNGMVSAADQSTLVWDPLRGYRAAGYGVVPLAALALPLVGFSAGVRRFLSDPTVALLGSALGVALVQFLLFAESGSRAVEGNLGKALQTILFLLCIEALRWFAFAWGEGPGRRTPGVLVAGAVVVVFVASGVVAFVADGLGPLVR